MHRIQNYASANKDYKSLWHKTFAVVKNISIFSYVTHIIIIIDSDLNKLKHILLRIFLYSYLYGIMDDLN